MELFIYLLFLFVVFFFCRLNFVSRLIFYHEETVREYCTNNWRDVRDGS